MANEKYCRNPGCINRVPFNRRLCDAHRRDVEGRLPSSPYEKSEHQKWYSRPRWRKLSRMIRNQNPFCKICLDAGKVNRSTQVDHITPHDGDPELFWDINNLQAVCASCHSIKTRTERGGTFRSLHEQ